jgi:pyruvate/2-oxoglutarate dehydrogenase complex dihydrolipoamide acyltransferase (E2) component
MHTEVRLPELGAAPVAVSVWFADVGELVFEGDRLVEIVTSGATFDVPAPATGRLVEKRVLPKESLTPGEILGVVVVESAERTNHVSH